jgi:hypothetical protein
MEGVEGMEAEKPSVRRFDWMPAAMPGVTSLVQERRRQWGDAHVTDCIKRSMRGEPGFFFAREGPIAVGTPWSDERIANFAALQVTATQALVVMKEPGHGAR